MASKNSTTQTEVKYRDVPGYLGYRVGDDGSVWSRRVRRSKCDKMGDTWNRLLGNPRKSGINYPLVTLVRDKIPKLIPIHRIVLLAFSGECPEGHECRHLDSNPANNHLSNLAWGTRAENARDRYRTGKFSNYPGRRADKINVELMGQMKITYQHPDAKHGYPVILNDSGEPYQSTAEAIKAVRARLRLSTKMFGQICGFSGRTVENWEQGRRSVPVVAMNMLSSAIHREEMWAKKDSKKSKVNS